MEKEIIATLNIAIKDAKKQLKEAIHRKDYSAAATSQSYLNGLDVAKVIVKLCAKVE